MSGDELKPSFMGGEATGVRRATLTIGSANPLVNSEIRGAIGTCAQSSRIA